MGSWYETCGITQLPIIAGDKVKLFVLKGDPSRTGWYHYTNDIWSPIGPPISGEYDDYGRIDKIAQDKAAEITFEAIKDNWPKQIPQIDYDTILPPDKMKLDDALYYIERDYIHPDNERFGLMFILDDVYQELMKFNPIEASFVTQPYLYKPIRQIYTENVAGFYEKTLEAVKKIDAEQDFQKRMSLELSMIISGIFSDVRNISNIYFKRSFMEAANKHLELTNPIVQELISLTVNMFLLDYCMIVSRKMWTPQTGKGSHNQELGIYSTITNAMNNIIQARKKQELEDSEEDGEDVRDAEGYLPYMRRHNADAEQGKQ